MRTPIVGVDTIRASFMNGSDLGRHDLLTLNKVLEHVLDMYEGLRAA